ncbi:hypothetical protein [Desulfatirhabdium butyrativorans]|nr:hypothetical protein [Desulfatirhabdium butyrativorans]
MNFSKAPHPPGIFSAMIGAEAAPLLLHPKTGAGNRFIRWEANR